MTELELPPIDYAAIAPILIMLSAAVVGVLVEAFVPRRLRHPVQLPLALLAVLAALTMVVVNADKRVITIGVIAVDGPTLFLQGAILALSAVALLLLGERVVERGGAFVAQAAVTADSPEDRRQAENAGGAGEVYPLTTFAIGGMLIFVSANDLLTMFIALEVFSLPLYLLCALARRRRLLSQEAAMKYFLLGAYASAFFLFGLALIYGFTAGLGDRVAGVDFATVNAAVANSTASPVLLFAGMALVAIGLLFKAAAAPFHVWTPDVYQGAPTPLTGFMAACTKVAAFGALLRVFHVAFEGARWDFTPVLGAVAVLTMLVGALFAVTQTDIKRLLAYSSIANAGYLLVGVLAPGSGGLSGTMFYLVAYGFTVLAAFAVVTLVRDADGEATHLSRWAGLGRRSPVYAAVFTFVLLAFAGIPMTSGFTSKFAVFGPALDGGQVWLVIAGVLTSMVLAFPYLRVVVLMWLSEPGDATPTVAVPGGLTSAALVIGVLATLVLGVAPDPLLDLASSAADFVR
ncbi:NADH-quinone oxidoreductase subunit NuoN [Verrucosispora sp. WMMA2044]|uniref:NADH-quinone oxidoreductase subunit N n=1 Tax=Verrucosispora sioxanthis TaxID=2499994 RepID=A0A6M1KXA5_9ACTN|nr:MULTISPECIES: NADH-quinone oxidoreductase subunit NuoN [Micromonospora]NEE63509.1 NADH-quinone oxidoreductase subunit NuoN [Verrucosispora sioxanthis]NGM12619.1 NADH-quinone oxidoreductase subunit NuoN [Verrucosispora sioxanthis]WBB47994.1 NADH-quinone oxidoreductase subunit NuoN [Verrucosispora sp. WMMA2044]